MLLGLHARIREMVNLHVHGKFLARSFHHTRQFQYRELLRELVVDTALSSLRGILAGNFNAAHRVADIQESAGLSAGSIYGQRLTDGRLHTEAVQNRAEYIVVVEAIDKGLVQFDFLGHGSIDHTLIQICGANAPDFAAKHDVVAVVNFRQMVKGARLLWIRQHILAAVVLNGDVAFLDIDIRSAVLTHGAQLNQVALGAQFTNREEHVHGAHHVVYLRKDGVLAVNHRIGGAALLRKVHYRVGLKGFDCGFQKIVIGHVAYEQFDSLTGNFLPDAQAVGKRSDGGKSLRAKLMIPLAA